MEVDERVANQRGYESVLVGLFLSKQVERVPVFRGYFLLYLKGALYLDERL